MKMAKASEADLKMAMELCGALESLERYRCFPQTLRPDPDDPANFDEDNTDHCREVLEYLLKLVGSASLMRVVWGCAVLLDPANKFVDPAADTLEHHPDALALESAKTAQDLERAMPATDPAVDAFMAEVQAELTRARAKFPGDRIMCLALAEEFGELCKAVLDEGAANVRKEAVQTAVMAARVALDGDSSVREWRQERGLDALVVIGGAA